jgi:hypothetical protein
MSVIGHNQNTVSINSLSTQDREKLKLAIQQLNDSLTRVAAERDFQKETINTLFEDTGVDKKIIRRMAKAYFKANFNDEVEENKSFEEFYTTILK